MTIALELSHVRKSFGEVTVLADLSLKIKKGETHAIVSPSGGGKSTLFRILLGYYEADSGLILHNGEDVSKKILSLRRIVGYTTQDDSFYPNLSPMENMRYYARLYRAKKTSKELLSILKDVELDKAKDTLVKNLSGGMRRRLNFAISLIHDPAILLLDEPTTGLDPRLVEQFWMIVKRVQKAGKTIIVTSHIFEELEAHADRVSFLYKGSIAKTTKAKKILSTFKAVCK